MPVLVDTSIWRRYLGGVNSVRQLGDLLDEGAVIVHPFVVGELVLGGLASREEALLRRLPRAELVPHDDVVEFVQQRGLTRRGIGWVDAHLLASALVSAAELWSADGDLVAAATELALAFGGRG